ncbi:hypothetical protein DDR33_21200 [Pararcticibacter amylolyticus]|uniref:Viral A-type inclusion protein n=2 Tax=Pararcticibacter amylolyticus TaxID=2173175 RepID=A0A2U2PB65_9SPHI|nr:hypothetical protein DDR33_21200 [Pararcticibacter amylolyticus]
MYFFRLSEYYFTFTVEMRNRSIYFLLALLISASACQTKSDYKAMRAEVIKLHDEVMARNDEVVHLQMKIDTLLRNMDSLKIKNPALDTAATQIILTAHLNGLKVAEEKMNDWMHQFQPDTEGKSGEESVAYFAEEKKKIEEIDSLYTVRTKETSGYLSQQKFK